MITRTYHYYATKRDSEGRVASYHEGTIAIESWMPRPAEKILAELRDSVRDNELDGIKPVVHSLTRIS